MNPLFKGKQVRLSSVTEEDLSLIAKWYENDQFLRIYNAEIAVPKTKKQLEKWLENAQNNPHGVLLAIRLLQDDRCIGFLEIDGILWPHQVGWLSIAIGDQDDRGKGFGKEAMILALQYAFSELNLYRIQLTVFSYNRPAIRLYERLGFRKEGVFRQFLQRDGERYDMVLYGLLRSEWQPLQLER
ncbi:GNAT family N-acetyltransferase [Hazenella coriacea]|uniref:RimJ/RimL family protein N-acetyltransferase n=1 Tax=Hazenella coriacea TaxID=1179467 RepID=A0A4R3LEL9_9BACL|nr:GNAT family protein [Hazenella coriacea]TCS96794.1 RimJ/RimL family protein N-acetyltransferase [Hazenella coriacea]